MRECGHVISAVDLMPFIIVLMDYTKFSFGLVFKVHDKEVCTSYAIIAKPFDTEEF